MTSKQMVLRSDSQMIQLNRTKIILIALKCPTVTSKPCPVCGKQHRYFWLLPDDVRFSPDNPRVPGYVSRRWCEAKAVQQKKEY